MTGTQPDPDLQGVPSTSPLPETDEDSSLPAWAPLSELLLETHPLETLLEEVLRCSLAAAGSATGASLMLVTPGSSDPMTAATASVAFLDRIQQARARGPAVDAAASTHRAHIDLARVRDRWPEFADAALEAGFKTVLTFPLRAGIRTIGSLVLYTGNPRGFPSQEVRCAEAVAGSAAVLLANGAALRAVQETAHQLRESQDTRSIIGVAEGLVMARQNCGREAAFAELRTASQRANRKLRDVAEELVSEHERRASPPQ